MNKANFRRTAALLTLSGALGLSACTNNEMGQAVGGALGGYLGSQIGDGAGQLAATAAGALIGSTIGGRIGETMDHVDRQRAYGALERAPTGQTVAWQNPDSGAQYAVTPTRTYETAGGPCREYTTDASIGGQREQIYGTACRQADGSWQVIQ